MENFAPGEQAQVVNPILIIIIVDGLTLYLSRTCNNLCSRAAGLLIYNISPLCDVAQTSDCGMFVFYFLL